MMESKNKKAISQIIAAFVKEIEGLLKQAFELVYFYRGAITYHQALQMSPGERELATTFINKRLEEAAKMPIPIY